MTHSKNLINALLLRSKNKSSLAKYLPDTANLFGGRLGSILNGYLLVRHSRSQSKSLYRLWTSAPLEGQLTIHTTCLRTQPPISSLCTTRTLSCFPSAHPPSPYCIPLAAPASSSPNPLPLSSTSGIEYPSVIFELVGGAAYSGMTPGLIRGPEFHPPSDIVLSELGILIPFDDVGGGPTELFHPPSDMVLSVLDILVGEVAGGGRAKASVWGRVGMGSDSLVARTASRDSSRCV